MKTCDTCKHWEGIDSDYQYVGMSLGICCATPMLFNATEWSDDEECDGRVMKGKYQSTTAFVQDGSDYRATLYTKNNHGCTMHETKTSPATANPQSKYQ